MSDLAYHPSDTDRRIRLRMGEGRLVLRGIFVLITSPYLLYMIGMALALLGPEAQLVYSFSAERKAGTMLQLFSLPVPRPFIGLSKFACSMTYA
jgi:hypothetical protein